MIWEITKKELLLNLLTFKFTVGTIVCVVLTVVFMPVLASDYQQRLKTYNDNIIRNEAELRKVKVYKNITPTIYRPPTALSVFSEGVEKQLNNSAKIELEALPEIGASRAEDNLYISIFPILDISLIFKIVISILSLLITYNAISGEREWGTLKLMLSGMVPRYQILIGKLLAALVTLTIPVTVAFIVGVLILLFFPMIDLTIVDWVRIGLMHLTSMIFIAAMCNVGLLFSCLARKSSVSLVLGLFFWIVCLVVIPNVSFYLATHIQPLESEEKLESALGLVAEKRDSELKEVSKNISSRFAGTTGTGAFGGMYIAVCDKHGMEHWNKNSILKEPIKIKYADRFLEVKQKYLSNLFKQKYLANNISRMSPIFLYENVMSILAGTDLANSRQFYEKVKLHRKKVIGYIRSKTNNFSTPSYFTIAKEGDWEEHEKILELCRQAQNETERKEAWEAFFKWKEKKYAESPSVVQQDFPRFIYQSDIIKSLLSTIPDLTLLVIINVLFFALSLAAFLRYDVR